MNIFVTSPDPKESAEALRHDKKRRGKMILESAQILCTALAPYCEVPYKPTHKNHPCVKWAGKMDNALWLYKYAMALEDIRIEMGDNPHESWKVIKKLKHAIKMLLPFGATPFVNCTPYKDLPVHEAYIKTLREKQSLN